MLSRFALLSAVLLVSACSSTEEPGLASSVPVSEREQITSAGGLNGTDLSSVTQDALNAEDLPAGAAATQSYLAEQIGDRVQFGYDSYTLSTQARQVLLSQAKWLQRFPNLTITIEGHCDERGTREYNLALGERRANSAKSYLVALGVSENRINVVSYGKERPAAAGSNEQAWAKNRRAVSVID